MRERSRELRQAESGPPVTLGDPEEPFPEEDDPVYDPGEPCPDEQPAGPEPDEPEAPLPPGPQMPDGLPWEEEGLQANPWEDGDASGG